MVRKLVVCFFVLMSVSLCFGERKLEYVGCIPESGSEISSFDFALEFNYDSVIAELGEGEYGISMCGFYSPFSPDLNQSVELYEGNRDTGKLLGRTLDWNTSGIDENFPLGNMVKFSFPEVIPEEGKTFDLHL